jgi:hypothetical protein
MTGTWLRVFGASVLALNSYWGSVSDRRSGADVK